VEGVMVDRRDDLLLGKFPRNLCLQLVSEDVDVSALQNMMSALPLERETFNGLTGELFVAVARPSSRSVSRPSSLSGTPNHSSGG
jgi:hypothetical protein